MRHGGPCASRPTCCCPSLPGLFFFTLLFYALSIAAVALLFVYYTQPGACYEGKAFIGLNLTLCVCVSIVAVLPKIQVRALPVSAQPETRPLGVWDSCRNLGGWEPGLSITEAGWSVGSQVSLLWLESRLLHLHAGCLWESALTSLCLSHLRC